MPDDDPLMSIRALESWLEHPLPPEYVRFLSTHEETVFGSSVLLYDVHSLIERNETFETQLYCPGYLAVGDDSGGRAFVISLLESFGRVYTVDHGDMTPQGLVPVTEDFLAWVRADCPLDAL